MEKGNEKSEKERKLNGKREWEKWKKRGGN